jgi:hypothetical protein
MVLKGLYTRILLIIGNACLAQQISGTIRDAESKAPIASAKISVGPLSTYSDVNGFFKLTGLSISDTIFINTIGFNPKQILQTTKPPPGGLIIYLSRSAISLKEVQIKAKNQYRLDSLKLRKDFEKVFSYKPKGIQDIFIGKSAESRKGMFRDPNSNSTASIASLDLGALFSLMGQRKQSLSKLQKTMLQDEQNKSVDQLFSKTKVSMLSGLHGDTLQAFMNLYRPKPLELQKMSGYELMLYIKRSTSAFLKTYRKMDALPELKPDKHADDEQE